MDGRLLLGKSASRQAAPTLAPESAASCRFAARRNTTCRAAAFNRVASPDAARTSCLSAAAEGFRFRRRRPQEAAMTDAGMTLDGRARRASEEALERRPEREPDRGRDRRGDPQRRHRQGASPRAVGPRQGERAGAARARASRRARRATGDRAIVRRRMATPRSPPRSARRAAAAGRTARPRTTRTS